MASKLFRKIRKDLDVGRNKVYLFHNESGKPLYKTSRFAPRVNAELLDPAFVKERFGGLDGYRKALSQKQHEMKIRHERPAPEQVARWLKDEYAEWLASRTGEDSGEVRRALDEPRFFERATTLARFKGLRLGSTARALSGPDSREAIRLAGKWGITKPDQVAAALRLAEGNREKAREIATMARDFGITPEGAGLIAGLPAGRKEHVKNLIKLDLLEPDAVEMIERLGRLPEREFSDIDRLARRNNLEVTTTSYILNRMEEEGTPGLGLATLGLAKRLRLSDLRDVDELISYVRRGMQKPEIVARMERSARHRGDEERSGE